MVAVAHSGIKLQPLRKRFQNTLSQLQTPHRTPPTSQRPNLISKSGSKSQHLSCRAECESGGEDFVPVRDIGPQSGNLKAQGKKQAEDAKDAKDACSVDEGSAEGEVKRQTVQYLLRELKALIFGEGNVSFPPVSRWTGLLVSCPGKMAFVMRCSLCRKPCRDAPPSTGTGHDLTFGKYKHPERHRCVIATEPERSAPQVTNAYRIPIFILLATSMAPNLLVRALRVFFFFQTRGGAAATLEASGESRDWESEWALQLSR